MLNVPEAFVRAAQAALANPPAGMDRWFLTYCGELAEPRGLRTYLRASQQIFALAGGVRGKVIIDAGSGFGMVANLAATWGAARAFAVEIHRPMVESHARLLAGPFAHLDRVHPVRGDVSRLPLRDRSADLVLSIEAISHYYDSDRFLDECARVLRPGGHLVISDGNNGANPRIRRQVEALWERLENGPPGRFGDSDVPEPMVERRARIIRDRFPGLDADRVRALAELTSGLDRAAIEAVVAPHLAGGPPPEFRYQRGQCPREPFWGYWVERLFDPSALARSLKARGFAVRAWPHYGGARNDLVLVANQLLRRVPTFRFARAFRIAARRG